MPSEAPTTTPAEPETGGPPVPVPTPAGEPGDIRRSRVYVLSRGPVVGFVRRVVSVAALVAADVAGLALGVYLALVLRSFVYGDTIYWSLLWDTGPADWLPFLAPITVIVFLQAGLYAPRERRAGSGRILAALVLVALIVLAFGLGTDYDFTTTGLIPTAVAASAISIGLLRAAYDSVSLELMERSGVRRRLLLVGDGATLVELERPLRANRSGIGVEVVGRLAIDPGPAGLGAAVDRLAALLEEERPDELVLAEARFDEQTVLHVVQLAHRYGVKVKLAPSTTELLVHEGEYVPGQGIPLFELRPPMLTGLEWATKRVFDVVVSIVFLGVGLPLWLLVAAAIKIESRGPVIYVDRRVGVREQEFGMLKFRTMVAGAADRQG